MTEKQAIYYELLVLRCRPSKCRLAEVAEKIKTSNTNDQTRKAVNGIAKAIIYNTKSAKAIRDL